ncbi:MAG: hypothetical protein VKJ46_11575 [Leptolyngbyaceae bacterium]|nr:hypothetical protein [Leptolyngbyaceae bacterium]
MLQPCVFLYGAWLLLEAAKVGQLNVIAPTHLRPVPFTSIALRCPSTSVLASNPDMHSQTVQIDPLDSPHPVPWNWVLANLTESSSTGIVKTRYYRSQSLVSPDGEYAAYSRIQMQAKPDFVQSRVSSVLFVENLKTGNVQSISATSPFSENSLPTAEGEQRGGMIAILIPVGWTKTGDRLLAREFESLFGSDIASDYAVIWHRDTNRVNTLAPSHIHYTNAVLLGWSQAHPDRVLFRAGILGEETWPLWTVDLSGQTTRALGDQPQVFGRSVNSALTGPQP